jgi:hypothetical protein
MNHPSFEAVKMAIKQDKNGYVLTLNVHPDDLDERIMRDYVGARYQVVMVRLDEDDTPLSREDFDGDRAIKIAGSMCKDPQFWAYLHKDSQIIEPSEEEATFWLRAYLDIQSRAELKSNQKARDGLFKIQKEFLSWRQKI